MEMNEKVAYIKGLMDGMNYDANSNEGKLFSAILDVLGDITEKVLVMDEEVGDLFEEVDAISEDLGDVEDALWEDDEDEDEDDEYEAGLYEITCPACGDVVCVDEEMLEDEDLACPNCNTKFDVDFDCDCDGCDCDDCEDCK